MARKENKRFRLSLLVLLLSVPLLAPSSGKVLCISSGDRPSVELPHGEAQHTAHPGGIAVEDVSISSSCGHSHCIDIPITSHLLATLTKADPTAKVQDAAKKAYAIVLAIFDDLYLPDSLALVQGVRVASLPQTSVHFLFRLVRTIVLLN